jgi:hypothetical protein
VVLLFNPKSTKAVVEFGIGGNACAIEVETVSTLCFEANIDVALIIG